MNEQREVEDLWWFLHSVENLVEKADADGTIRVGAARWVSVSSGMG